MWYILAPQSGQSIPWPAANAYMAYANPPERIWLPPKTSIPNDNLITPSAQEASQVVTP